MAATPLYDPAKAEANLRKHGVSLADADGVLKDPLAVTIEDRDARAESRFVSIGIGSAGTTLVVVHTSRSDGIRIISARRATRNERSQYEG
jgi:uncharacterized DUF497 family protein